MHRINNNEPTVFGHPNFFNYSPEKTKELEEPKDIHQQIEEAAKALEEIQPAVQKSQSRTPYVLLGVAMAAIAALAYQNYSLNQQPQPTNQANTPFDPACISSGECWKSDRIQCHNLLHTLFGTKTASDLTSLFNSNIDEVHKFLATTSDQIKFSNSITFVNDTSYLRALIEGGCSNTLLHVDFSKYSDQEIVNSLISASRARNEKLVQQLLDITTQKQIHIDKDTFYQMLSESNNSFNQQRIGLRNYAGHIAPQYDARTIVEKEGVTNTTTKHPAFRIAMEAELRNLAEKLNAGAAIEPSTLHRALEHYYRFNREFLRQFLTENPEYTILFQNHDSHIQMTKYVSSGNLGYQKV